MADAQQTLPPGGTGTIGGATVSRIGFGAMQLPGPRVWGPPRDRAGALAVLRRAVQLGVDHVDTAQFYGAGVANELIHAALYPYPADLMLVSKVGAERDAEGGWIPAQRPEQLRAGVEANLRTLNVERLGVVNLRLIGGGHGIQAPAEQRVDLDSQLAELQALRDEGKIGGIGLSNASLEQVRQALPVGIACVQNAYSLLDRAGEPLLDLCRAHGIAWVPFFPLGSAFPNQPKVTRATGGDRVSRTARGNAGADRPRLAAGACAPHSAHPGHVQRCPSGGKCRRRSGPPRSGDAGPAGRAGAARAPGGLDDQLGCCQRSGRASA